MSLRVVGDAVQVWQGGRQIGNLYRYNLSGDSTAWRASAMKYRLAPEYDGGECRFVFAVGAEKVLLQLEAVGMLGDHGIADGTVRREPITAKGHGLCLMGESRRSG